MKCPQGTQYKLQQHAKLESGTHRQLGAPATAQTCTWQSAAQAAQEKERPGSRHPSRPWLRLAVGFFFSYLFYSLSTSYHWCITLVHTMGVCCLYTHTPKVQCVLAHVTPQRLPSLPSSHPWSLSSVTSLGFSDLVSSTRKIHSHIIVGFIKLKTELHLWNLTPACTLPSDLSWNISPRVLLHKVTLAAWFG